MNGAKAYLKDCPLPDLINIGIAYIPVNCPVTPHILRCGNLDCYTMLLVQYFTLIISDAIL